MLRKAGNYEKLGDMNYFIPEPLPPQNPSLKLDNELIIVYGRAMQQLGQLNEMSLRIPDMKRFIRAYVIKEALLSSAIEGIHTTLMHVYTQPLNTMKNPKETQLVKNYVEALDNSISMIKQQGMSIATRMLLKTHATLMQAGEGEKACSGQFRRQSVRVGNLVPPPAQKVPELIASLERFINEDNSLPPLIKAGLAHVQFETIHPFLDDNGRIGRLLIVLMLIDSQILLVPILYPSYYFKKYHLEYYQNLDIVRTEGNYEQWLLYYLKAIEASSLDAYRRAKEIEALENECKERIMSSEAFAKSRGIALQALSILFTHPFISVSSLAEHLVKSYNATSNLVRLFIEQGLLQQVIMQRRNRIFSFSPYVEILEKEYD